MAILAIKNAFRGMFRRKKPWFMFTSTGITAEGQVELEMEWNAAFVKHVRSEGFIGHSDEECVQMFLMSFTRRHEDIQGNEPVNPDAHPFLNEETGNLVRR